jgi:hypothetical protein
LSRPGAPRARCGIADTTAVAPGLQQQIQFAQSAQVGRSSQVCVGLSGAWHFLRLRCLLIACVACAASSEPLLVVPHRGRRTGSPPTPPRTGSLPRSRGRPLKSGGYRQPSAHAAGDPVDRQARATRATPIIEPISLNSDRIRVGGSLRNRWSRDRCKHQQTWLAHIGRTRHEMISLAKGGTLPHTEPARLDATQGATFPAVPSVTTRRPEALPRRHCQDSGSLFTAPG